MVWSHVCNSNWVTDRTALAVFPSTPRQWIQGEGRLITGERSELRHLGRTRKQAVVSFFLLTAVCSGASVEHETLMEKLNPIQKKKTPKNKSSYNIMVLMAFKSLQFFPLWLPPMGRYLKWCCEGMWLNIKCHGNGHWFGFGEKFHIIFFIIRCVTSLVSTSGIIWPTY